MRAFYALFFLIIHVTGFSSLYVGIAKSDITPPIGTPSAGYTDRKGEGMEGIHDPLLAIALFIDNGKRKIVLCSVDHLGFPYEMTQKIIEQVHKTPSLSNAEIYIASSHTHSGGGAYLNIPRLGESLAGSYNQAIVDFYIEKTAQTIIKASESPILAKIGIGYKEADPISTYRGTWPTISSPLSDLMILKITKLDDTPLAVLFNYPMHPTVLKSQNKLFSADFVAEARNQIETLLGSNIQALYFNGAQGDILPKVFDETDLWNSCHILGTSLANTVKKAWESTNTSDLLDVATYKTSYTFQPKATPFGTLLPINEYATEINLLVLNKNHAFVTIPGELSSLYDRSLKKAGKDLGFSHLSIFGLTNDAHGYIILPESWRHKTMESSLSFGGEEYGTLTEYRALSLLKEASTLK